MTHTSRRDVLRAGGIVAGTLPLGGLAFARRVTAEGAQVFEIPLTPTQLVACEETVQMLDGYAQLVFHLEPTGDDRYHLNFTYAFKNFHGVGAETGLTYRAVGTTVATINHLVEPPYPYEEMYEARQRVVSQGSREDQVLRGTSHYTVNAKGDVTVDRYVDVSLECV